MKVFCRDKVFVAIFLMITVVLAVGSLQAESAPYRIDPLSAIERDFKAGQLTLDEKVLLQIKAIKKPTELPVKYQVDIAEISPAGLRSATMALREIRMAWDQLLPSTRLAVSAAITRPPGEYTYASPSGFFLLHYDIEGTDAVPTADANSNGIPDYIEKCASYCDTSWTVHNTQGDLSPPSDNGLGGDSKYDVYFEEMDYYGYTQGEMEGPEPWFDYTSYVSFHRNFIGFPPNDDPEGQWQGAAKATAAHEFHHAVQYAYDASEDLWFMELDAVYMEDIVFDHVNDNYNYMGSFFVTPEKSLMENTFHAYSAFIWGMFLAEKFDTSMMRAIWEGARYSPTVFEATGDTLEGRYGWTQDSAFAEFATWNYATASRDDGLHYEEGSDYLHVTIGRSHTYLPTPLQNSPKSPAGYAACYVSFIPNGTEDGLRVTFDGADSRQWAAYLIKSFSSNSHEFMKLQLDPTTAEGEIVIADYSFLEKATLVGINLTEFSSGANFSYSAEEYLEYAIESELVSSPVVYSGGAVELGYYVKNVAAVYDIVDMIVSDAEGWVEVDTISKSLASGQDTTIYVPVNPPQGTPLASTTQLNFKAVSWGNSDIVDSVVATAQVVLQTGDANFSGSINISDVTYLVGFLFGLPLGPEPIPVLDAGDFNCNGQVNISDISATVEYLFGQGDPPHCNPY
ncbi:MAG: hypothetical protein KAT79_02575 [candidate division Zixibacteria bacterium]|nr:hypothetical protein [candidate division Zixibacteria bacterium]